MKDCLRSSSGREASASFVLPSVGLGGIVVRERERRGIKREMGKFGWSRGRSKSKTRVNGETDKEAGMERKSICKIQLEQKRKNEGIFYISDK